MLNDVRGVQLSHYSLYLYHTVYESSYNMKSHPQKLNQSSDLEESMKTCVTVSLKDDAGDILQYIFVIVKNSEGLQG